MSGDEIQYSFEIPYGVTDSALVKVVGVDIYGNEGYALSGYFSVTDNTAPNVQIEPINESVAIGDTMDVAWVSNDNSGITTSVVYFREDFNSGFTKIDSLDGAVTNIQWVASNVVTDSAQFMIKIKDFSR